MALAVRPRGFSLLICFLFQVYTGLPCPRTVDYPHQQAIQYRDDCPVTIPEMFSGCISSLCYPSNANISDAIFTPNNYSFTSVLNSTVQNLRFLRPGTPKPVLIFIPWTESHIQAAVSCSVFHGLNFRVRSGGHDYEGVSYVSQIEQPFIVIDMSRLRQVTVDILEKSVWAQSGATNGEVYYRIYEKSKTLGVPMGVCTSLGMGGHISGGAYGSMMRKYGLGVDNVVDVRMVDSRGRIVDRATMGEALFWATRGGGGGSFGIILAWKLRLVDVPTTVTVFNVAKTLEHGATRLLSRWQQVASTVDEDLFIRVIVSPTKTGNGTKTISTLYSALFLGTSKRLLPIMTQSFPELGLVKTDCVEMSWIESVVSIGGFPSGTPPKVLLTGKPAFKNEFKAKSDFFRKPIPESGLEGLWKLMMEEENPLIIMTPYGGIMDSVPEYATPFPHRKGVLGMIHYVSTWNGGNEEAEAQHIQWTRKVYAYMEQYMPKHPREAYVNYRDLDLGSNTAGEIDFIEALSWGGSYFKNNILPLMKVKARADPFNVFRHEQSIPPLYF